MSWTPAQYISQRKEEIELLDRILHAKKSICDREDVLIESDGPMPPEGVATLNEDFEKEQNMEEA